MTAWFPWPMTAMVAIALTACHLYATASTRDRSGRMLLALGGVLTFGFVLVPLALSVNAACSDTGGGMELRAAWLMVAAGAALLACGLLALLYRMAGSPDGQTFVLPMVIMMAAAVGLLLEYGFSLFSFSVYCEDGSLWALYVQLIVAAFASALGGWILVRRVVG